MARPKQSLDPEERTTLHKALDKAYEQLYDLISDPEFVNIPLKDKVSVYRVLSYFKGTAVKSPDDGVNRKRADRAGQVLQQVHDLSEKRRAGA